jgi:hypothetical protein
MLARLKVAVDKQHKTNEVTHTKFQEAATSREIEI